MSDKTKNELKKFLPPIASVENPVDMVASGVVNTMERAIDILVADENVDIILTLVIRLKIPGIDFAKAILKKKELYPEKCIIGIAPYDDEFFIELANTGKINMPFFTLPEDAAKALKRTLEFQKWQQRPEGEVSVFNDIDVKKINELLGKKNLDKNELFELFNNYGIKTINNVGNNNRILSIKVEEDNIYGKLISISLGGIYFGTIEEKNHRIIPISNLDSEDMIAEMKMRKVLDDVNGLKKVDTKKIQEILERISQLISQHKEIKELIIKSLVVNENDGELYINDAEIKF